MDGKRLPSWPTSSCPSTPRSKKRTSPGSPLRVGRFTAALSRTRRSSRLGESLSDYEAVGEVAKKLGLYEDFTRGMTVKEKIKFGFE